MVTVLPYAEINLMNEMFKDAGDVTARNAQLPPWSECELFCTNADSGVGDPACGWRGIRQDAQRDAYGTKLLCPQCGRATLFRLPGA